MSLLYQNGAIVMTTLFMYVTVQEAIAGRNTSKKKWNCGIQTQEFNLDCASTCIEQA